MDELAIKCNISIKALLNFQAKKVLIENFIYSTLNYCPLVWHFHKAKSLQKMENIQKRALKYLHDDFESGYS